MECVQVSGLKCWQPGNFDEAAARWMDDSGVGSQEAAGSSGSPPLSIASPPHSLELEQFMPHSAPSTCSMLTSTCRRTATFPFANRAFLEGQLNVSGFLLSFSVC